MIDNKNKPELTNLEKSTSSDQNNLVKSTKSDLNNYLYLQNAAQSLTTIQAALPTLVNERTLRRWLTDAVNTGLAIRTGKHRSTKYMANKSIKENEFKFLENKSASQKKAILSQIRDLWTHTSTAIEGNTLSLGDTHFLLEEGLTVSGKAIKEHQEIIGHASAIELIYRTLDKDVDAAFCFDLHKAIQSEIIWDIDKPNGAWKVVSNGTYTVDENNKPAYLEYASPQHVSKLMDTWLFELNQVNTSELSASNAHITYARLHASFAHIHPFWDGNGRLARLLANVPLLRAGLPPIVIPIERRREYIQLLAAYQIGSDVLTPCTGILPCKGKLTPFIEFCHSCYQTTQDVIDQFN